MKIIPKYIDEEKKIKNTDSYPKIRSNNEVVFNDGNIKLSDNAFESLISLVTISKGSVISSCIFIKETDTNELFLVPLNSNFYKEALKNETISIKNINAGDIIFEKNEGKEFLFLGSFWMNYFYSFYDEITQVRFHYLLELKTNKIIKKRKLIISSVEGINEEFQNKEKNLVFIKNNTEQFQERKVSIIKITDLKEFND